MLSTPTLPVLDTAILRSWRICLEGLDSIATLSGAIDSLRSIGLVKAKSISILGRLRVAYGRIDDRHLHRASASIIRLPGAAPSSRGHH